MRKDYTKKLIEYLDKTETVLKRNYGENPYSDNRSRLISLFINHPYYINEISKLKDHFKDIPVNRNKQEVFLWEQSNPDNVNLIRKQIEKLISEFNFNIIYADDIKQFTYNYIICPSRNEKMSRENIPALVITNTSDIREVNAYLVSNNSRYIQVFDWTTLKDIQDNWSKIKGNMAEKSLDIDISDKLSNTLWGLKLQNKSIKEITSFINSNYKNLLSKIKDNIIGENDVRIYIHRYKKRLKKLRNF